jgi:hypothetical protein
LNAQAERFKRSIKSVRLDHLIFFGPATLDHALREYAAHYNGERNQQGLGNRLLTETPKIGRGRLLKPGRLGGLLNWFIRLLAPVAGRGKRRRLPQTGRPSVFPWFFSGFGSAAFL